MMTPCIQTEKIARLIVNDKVQGRGTFPAMKNLEKQFRSAGYRTHVGYADFYNGTCYCKKCGDIVVKPYTYQYQGHQYYKCGKCETVNFV
ncbi:MAG TPA: hypothetical protein VK152_06745 [Paludibacter sp.]|nr:hypothetical protein [Paludibacter sp.]